MIAIVDYGVGNLYSLTCSLRHIGAQALVTRDEAELQAAEKIILPGVGAFGDAADKLRTLKLDTLLKQQAAGCRFRDVFDQHVFQLRRATW